MLLKLRNRHFFVLDLLLLLITPTLALTLRVYLPWETGQYTFGLAVYTLLSLLIKLPVFHSFQLYRRYWRYASIDSMLSIITAVMIASFLIAGVFFGLHIVGLFDGLALPRTVPAIDALLTLVAVAGTRFSVRAMEYRKANRNRSEQDKRVLIAGAGDAGQIVAREIFSSRRVNLDLVGFVDDNPDKIGSYIHGAPVVGALDRIPEVVEKYNVQEVIVAMPTAPGTVIRAVVDVCKEVGVDTKTVPGVYELLTGDVDVNRLREIKIDDLLRREPIRTDLSRVKNMIAGKRVLVTGAGGSIGSELCAQIITFQPDRLIALGHGENSLFSLSKQLKSQGQRDSGMDIDLVVADVRDRPRLETIFNRYRPDIVYHAAAHKHVPLMEANVEEAVTNNVLGTLNMVEVALEMDVEHFVLISTDKAVDPVNVMGMTKRLAELLVRLAAVETGRSYVAVRFGNVLGSRGSVVPLFQRQIAAGGPVTVTHPEMRRFFMTIPEAVQLVIQASAMGTSGEVFVLDMGEPVKIVDLARDMIGLSGYQVGEEIEIEFSGIRPGERLDEKLFADGETCKRTEHQKIFVTLNDFSIATNAFRRQLDELISLAREGKREQLREKLTQVASEQY
jgi:FlaA1/EpsC-like NDP-sugar epimerase